MIINSNIIVLNPLELGSIVVVGSRVVLIVTEVDTVGARVGGGAKNDKLQLFTLTLTLSDILSSINSMTRVALDFRNAPEVLKSVMKTMLGGVWSSLLKSTA